MYDTEIAYQIAALPMQWDKAGKLRVLLITSRDTGRWVVPKGWLMEGKTQQRAAEIEALEEAGAVGTVSKHPIGQYCYDKHYEGKDSVPCRVTLYPMAVQKLKRRWKEKNERTRRWFSPNKAAELVDEKDLSHLLKSLSNDPKTVTVTESLRRAAQDASN